MNSSQPDGRVRPHRILERTRMVLAGAALCVGCGPPTTAPPPPGEQVGVGAALDAPFEQIVFAQGQLEPAGGVVPIVAAPGDRLEKLLVSEGDSVTAGMPVGRLASRELREAELEVARIQFEEAQTTQQATLAAARAELEVAAAGVAMKRVQLRDAEAALERAQTGGGELDLLRQRTELASDKLAQMRQAAERTDAARLISENALRQQELATQAAQAEWEAARRQAESTVQAAELMLDVAEKERRAAELQIEAAQQGAPLKSLEQKIEVLRQQIEAASLTSPVDGVVVAVDMAPGQPTSNVPVMRVANLSQMVCRAEVPVALLPRIAIGNEAAISGGGLGDEALGGRVTKISRIAGAPRLPSPDPRQQVDYRSAEVVIEIDTEDVPRAAGRINAQVDVAIRAED